MSDPRTEVPQAVQAMPAVGAISLGVSGVDINWWAALLGAIFLILQILYLLWKWYGDWQDRSKRRGRK